MLKRQRRVYKVCEGCSKLRYIADMDGVGTQGFYCDPEGLINTSIEQWERNNVCKATCIRRMEHLVMRKHNVIRPS